jgi:ribosomal protein S18 acetylase RimI-like enzyme
MQIEILTANHKDLNVILQLQKDCYMTEAKIHNNYNIPPLNQDLKSIENDFNKMTILKGEIDGQIIASVRGFSENGTCYIGRLIVKNEFQNKGFGKLLMDSIESIFKECNRFELFTGFKSQKNLYLYNKLGYNEFKREVINDKLTLIYLEKKRQ